jgi:hypothetical protein
VRYSELIGAPVIDWKEELSGKPTLDKAVRVKLAGSWQTCVCGQMDTSVPRAEITHCPEDHILASRGSDFVLAINIEDQAMALRLYHEICDRCDQLGYPVPGEEIHEEKTASRQGNDQGRIPCQTG